MEPSIASFLFPLGWNQFLHQSGQLTVTWNHAQQFLHQCASFLCYLEPCPAAVSASMCQLPLLPGTMLRIVAYPNPVISCVNMQNYSYGSGAFDPPTQRATSLYMLSACIIGTEHFRNPTKMQKAEMLRVMLLASSMLMMISVSAG